MMERRPCGACRELVPVRTGCKHWRPGNGREALAESRRKKAAKVSAAVAAFHRSIGARDQ